MTTNHSNLQVGRNAFKLDLKLLDFHLKTGDCILCQGEIGRQGAENNRLVVVSASTISWGERRSQPRCRPLLPGQAASSALVPPHLNE